MSATCASAASGGMAGWDALTEEELAGHSVLEGGRVIVFAVSDPAGTWGLGVVEAGAEDDRRARGVDDPAVMSRMATFEVYSMLMAVIRH